MTKNIALAAILACGAAGFSSGCSSQPTTNATNMAVVNSHCPIQPDDPINPSVTTTWKGQKVAFCCPGCIDEWDAKTDDQKAAAISKAK